MDTRKLSYSAMAVEAVYIMAEKHGSSLQSIRKYIIANFPIKVQQTASFNALTLKAVNNAVAEKLLDRFKNTFKVSPIEKERRRRLARNISSMVNRDRYPNDEVHVTVRLYPVLVGRS